jgi:fucose 4-O-acetylase-like acetyltransferase
MLDIIPMALAFIAMGYVARTSTIFDKILSFWWFKYTSIVLGIMTWALGTYAYIKVDYAGRNFDNPFLVLLYGIIGISFFISLAQILARYKITSNIFAAFGQSSMWIMCFHFVAFKVAFWGLYAFDLVPQIQVYELIPIKTHTNFWPLYLIIGLLIPIFLRKSFDLFRIDSQENLKNYSSKCFNIGLTALLFVAFFNLGRFQLYLDLQRKSFLCSR